jgi:hypothetical protein
MSWSQLDELKRIYIFIAPAIFLISAGCFYACKEKEEELKNPFRDNIIGQWKLVEVSVYKNIELLETTDYSNENIIFDFQKNNKLVVRRNIPDVLVVVDDCPEGEYFYEYHRPNVCPSCKPGPSLFIDNPELGERYYFCFPLLSEETMAIDKYSWMRDDDYGWSIVIKLN